MSEGSERVTRATGTTTSAGGAPPAGTTPRWPWLGKGQMYLLIAAAPMGFGSFLPWLETAFGGFSGMAGPGLVTLAGAMLLVAGALLRRRGLVVAHGAAAAAIGIGLPIWQTVRAFTLVGMAGWAPGGGMLLVLAGGIGAGMATRRIVLERHPV